MDAKEYQRQWYEKNKEAVKARTRAWRAANKERKRAIDKAYREANLERIVQRQREYQKKNSKARTAYSVSWRNANLERQRAAEARYRGRNREACSIRIKEWKAKNRPLMAFYSRTRQARLIQATPVWADVEAMKAIYVQAAQRRIETGKEWHVDHIVPLISPRVCGLHVPANLQLMYGPDNEKKNNRHWPDMP